MWIKLHFCLLYCRTIRLENGLTALLISDPSRPFISNESGSSEEESSGTDESTDQESDDGKSVQSASSDQHGTKRRAEFDEEKLVSYELAFYVKIFQIWLAGSMWLLISYNLLQYNVITSKVNKIYKYDSLKNMSTVVHICL